MGKTAAELMAELANDGEYQAKKKAKDDYFSNLERIYADDEGGLVEELNQAGFLVTSVWDFVNSKNYYSDAVPILIKHLKTKHHPKILAGLARSLAVTQFSNNDDLWNLLVDLYEKTLSDSEINNPVERGLQEAIAVALECLAIESRIDSLKKLVATVPNGDGIHWLKNKLNKSVKKSNT
ncbi:MAG: hypothetical protein HOO93_17305 [Methyloglobulus sp.]|nr:hypothetical protein [Methyloglobulus sp.]